jgi:hypothetical protein
MRAEDWTRWLYRRAIVASEFDEFKVTRQKYLYTGIMHTYAYVKYSGSANRHRWRRRRPRAGARESALGL